MHGAHRASGEMLEQPLPHILESVAGRPCGLVSVSPECPAAAAGSTGGGGGSSACQNAENACAANQGLSEIVIIQPDLRQVFQSQINIQTTYPSTEPFSEKPNRKVHLKVHFV